MCEIWHKIENRLLLARACGKGIEPELFLAQVLLYQNYFSPKFSYRAKICVTLTV